MKIAKEKKISVVYTRDNKTKGQSHLKPLRRELSVFVILQCQSKLSSYVPHNILPKTFFPVLCVHPLARSRTYYMLHIHFLKTSFSFCALLYYTQAVSCTPPCTPVFPSTPLKILMHSDVYDAPRLSSPHYIIILLCLLLIYLARVFR